MIYLCYPFKVMRITQDYDGETSHYGHSHGSPHDFPIDEGVSDSGRDPMYAPCDLIVRRIWGVGTKGVNTLFVRSKYKVVTACGRIDYVCMQITHENDEDLRKYKVGDVIKYRTVVCREGTDGATANHIHLSVGYGDFKGNCWMQNSRGKYVLTTTGGTAKPEDVFFIDKSFTRILNSRHLVFKVVPFTTGSYKVERAAYVRIGAGKKYARKTFGGFTDNAKKQIKKLNDGQPADEFVKGVTFSCTSVEYNESDKLTWGKCSSGWVCLNKCRYEA